MCIRDRITLTCDKDVINVDYEDEFYVAVVISPYDKVFVEARDAAFEVCLDVVEQGKLPQEWCVYQSIRGFEKFDNVVPCSWPGWKLVRFNGVEMLPSYLWKLHVDFTWSTYIMA